MPYDPVRDNHHPRQEDDQWKRPTSSSSQSQGPGGQGEFVPPFPPMHQHDDRRRSSGAVSDAGRGSMPPPLLPGMYPPSIGSAMYRSASGESDHDRPSVLGGTFISPRASPAYSRGSLPPSGSYFPNQSQSQYPHQVSPAPQASPRSSISHLLTPSDPPRQLSTPYIPPLQPFAYTPTSPHGSRPSSSSGPPARSSLQGWTNDEPLRREYEPVMRRITPSRPSIAGIMNPSDDETKPQPSVWYPRDLPTQRAESESPVHREHRRTASEQEMSAAEALSALAGTGTRTGTVPRLLQEVVQPERERESENENENQREMEEPAQEQGLSTDEPISPRSTPVEEPATKKRKRVVGKAEEEVTFEKGKSGAGRKRKVSVPVPVPGGEADAPSTPTQTAATAPAKSRKRPPKDKPNEAPLATPPAPVPTAYNPTRISDPVTVLRPLGADELAYISNPRNIKNPLKTFRPVKFGGDGGDGGAYALREVAPPLEEERVIERGGDRRGQGLEDGQAGMGRAVSAKRGRSDVLDGPEDGTRTDSAKRPKVGGEIGKGYQVAEHYNKRGNQGLDNRGKSAIIGLRSCNNWIKAVMIQTYVRRRPGRPYGREPNGRVLDMGCGKGGDIAKWERANIQDYVGCDVAAGSIEDFKVRLASLRKRPRFHAELFVLDCFRQSILEIPRRLLSDRFDNVSMQFCIHYAFEKVQNVRQMLENVAIYLREGGIYFGTTVSKDKITTALNEIPPDSEELVIKNDYFRMEFTEREHEGPFGHAYKFSLTDAIDDCEEYVVDWGEFTSIAAEYKLKCIYRKDFDEMFVEHTQNPDFAAMAKRMQVIDEEGDLYMDPGQWAAVSMYLGFAFEKMPISWNPTRDALIAQVPAIGPDALPY